jgi:hypothetical protein
VIAEFWGPYLVIFGERNSTVISSSDSIVRWPSYNKGLAKNQQWPLNLKSWLSLWYLVEPVYKCRGSKNKLRQRKSIRIHRNISGRFCIEVLGEPLCSWCSCGLFTFFTSLWYIWSIISILITQAPTHPGLCVTLWKRVSVFVEGNNRHSCVECSELWGQSP